MNKIKVGDLVYCKHSPQFFGIVTEALYSEGLFYDDLFYIEWQSENYFDNVQKGSYLVKAVV